MSTRLEIPVIVRRTLSDAEPEYREMWKYESGEAEKDASAVAGTHAEPWLNVLEEREFGSPAALEKMIADPEIGPRLRGRVIDLGAGTCWVTARLSKVPAIEEVVALDMSEHFLTEVGSRVIGHCGGDASKIRFAVGSFNEIPFPAGSFDCAFLVAALHHSLSPLKTLLEARRVLTAGGMLVMVETPSSVIRVRQNRLDSLELSRTSGATEVCYTTGEIDYMLRHAGFASVTYHPVDAFTRGFARKTVRRLLRAAGLENFFKPPIYIIIARGGAAS